MSLESITFTGVDDHTDLDDLAALMRTFKVVPVEMGVLIGSATFNEPGGIFPSPQRVTDLRDLGRILGFRTALHICGELARNLMRPTEEQQVYLATHTYALSRGFTRVQINLHGDTWNSERIETNADLLLLRLAYLGNSLILQHRDDWEALPVEDPRVFYLFDRSEGRGEEEFASWPPPPDPSRLPLVGYAGGIGPDNISQAVTFALEAPGLIWLDMESRVRTEGIFDLAKVNAVYTRAVAEMTRQGVR